MNSILALFKTAANQDNGGVTVIDAPPPVLDTVTPPATPPMYAVLLQNDGTTMPVFVVMVLAHVFGKDRAQSISIMMSAHTSGKALVTVVSRDMAETLVSQAHDFIKSSTAKKSMLPDGACELTFTSIMETPGDAA